MFLGISFYPTFELGNGRFRLVIHWGINSMQSIEDRAKMHGLADSSASSSRPTDYSVGTNAINTTQAQRMVSKYFNSQH